MYPLETRELAVEAVAAGFGPTEAAELVGCSRTAVANWAKAAGVALPPRKKAVYLPFDRKMELVARLEAGERAADLAEEAGVCAQSVLNWRRRLREEGALSLMDGPDIAARAPEPREAPSELDELRARCEELELRNAVLEGTIEILKKDPGADLSALTATERAALAERLRGRFGLRAALSALSLPRSTFYDRLAALSAPDPYAALRPLVRAAFEGSGGAYGYRRVRAELARGAGTPQRARGAGSLDPARPVAVSEKVVRRIMAEEGLAARAPRAARWSSYAGEEGRAAAPNLLLVDAARDLHDFSAAAPGEALVTDITEFRLPDDPRKVYLSPAIDLFDGDVAAFSVGTSPSKALVAEMLDGAVASCSTATAAGTTARPTGCAPAPRRGSRGRCRARATRPTTLPARASSAGSRRSSSTGATGAGSPPSGSPPSCPSGSAGTAREGSSCSTTATGRRTIR